MNAVACELQVIATGARAADSDGQRELFTEETTTALVFENGGVLKLAAAVAPGQLLFLTHKESKREVVAQVMRKRDFRPTICYVEVEFSEPSPGFWGVKFPELPAEAPVRAKARQKEAEHSYPLALELIVDEPSAPAAPSAQDVAALKNEVEALREQLQLLQTQTVAANLSSTALAPEVSRQAQPLEQLPSAADEPSQELSTEDSGAAASADAASLDASAPAISELNEPAFSEEDLLPKPALDFGKATALAKRSSKSKTKAKAEPKQQVVVAGSQPSAMRKDLLFAAFVLVVLGAAWYQNMLPWLPRPKIFSGSAATSVVVPPAAQPPVKTAKAARAAQAGTAPAAAESSTAAHDAGHDAAQPAALDAAKPSMPAATETAGAVAATPKDAADAAVTQERPREKPEIAASAKKRGATPALSKASMISAAEPADLAGVVQPKLIKSVRAVASPSALQDFSAGGAENVTFDALVDASGRVKSMKALSGAVALRNAAMEALKQYQYEPATQRGRPVAAHVTVTVKFLFEP